MSQTYSMAFSDSFIEEYGSLEIAAQKQTEKALNKLTRMQFDYGLRVKRLKSKPQYAFWECRINDHLRVLFTFHKQSQGIIEISEKINILVWTILDKRKDKANLRISNLSYQAVFTDQNIASDIEWSGSIPTHPYVNMTEIESVKLDQNYWQVYKHLSDEFADDGDDAPDSRSWSIGDIDSIPFKAEMLLTPIQYEKIHNGMPLLINGSAGTGKTTVSVYKLAQLAIKQNRSKICYVTRSMLLKNSAQNLFSKLSTSISENITFRTYWQYQNRLLNKSSLTNSIIEWRNVVELLIQQGLNYSTAYDIVGEIRGVLKGTIYRNSEGRVIDLPYDKYRKQLKEVRSEKWLEMLEAKYEWYKKYLLANGLMDDQDIAALIINSGDECPPKSGADILVIDEVQDLSDRQIYCLLSSIPENNGRNVVISGDVNQSVVPTSFRWSNINNLYYSMGWDSPQINVLKKNFRNTDSITQVGNQLLSLMHDYYKAEGITSAEFSDKPGDPIRVIESMDQVSQAYDPENPESVLIIRDEADKSLLNNNNGWEFIFTAAQIKGMEFDDVILIYPDRYLPNDMYGDYLDASKSISMLYELRILYVGITRARKHLYIFPYNHNHPIWDALLKDTVRVSESNERLQVENEDWRRKGLQYLDSSLITAAKQSFLKGGYEQWSFICSWLDDQTLEKENEMMKMLEPYDDPDLFSWLRDHISLIKINENRLFIYKRLGDIRGIRDIESKIAHSPSVEQSEMRVQKQTVTDINQFEGNSKVPSGLQVNHERRDIHPRANFEQVQMVQTAKMLKRGKKYSEAIALYMEIINKFPNGAHAYSALGKAAYLDKQYNLAANGYMLGLSIELNIEEAKGNLTAKNFTARVKRFKSKRRRKGVVDSDFITDDTPRHLSHSLIDPLLFDSGYKKQIARYRKRTRGKNVQLSDQDYAYEKAHLMCGHAIVRSVLNRYRTTILDIDIEHEVMLNEQDLDQFHTVFKKSF